jgi:hypothetical protein
MILLDTWQQTALFDPTNPGQRMIESYTGLPGGYSTFYFNRVPNTASALNGIAEDLGLKALGWVGIAALLGGTAFVVYKMEKAFQKRNW